MDSDEDTKDGIIVHPDDPVPWFPGQEDDQSPESDHLDKPARLKRRRRCGQCGPCQIRANCGECSNCLRRSVLKQSCIYRKCIYLRKPVHVSGTPKTPPRQRSNGIYLTSSCEEDLDSSYELMSPPGIEINGFSMAETSTGDDTEILIEDYTPTPSIIIGGFDDEQPSSPIRIAMDRESGSRSFEMCEDRIKTPPHPMDCDESSCVNPRQFNALRANKQAKSSKSTESIENATRVTSAEDVCSSFLDPYAINLGQKTMQTVSENDKAVDGFRTSTEYSASIKSALEKDSLVSRSSSEHRSAVEHSSKHMPASEHKQTRLSESHSAISQQLSKETPRASAAEPQSKSYNQIHTEENWNENVPGSARLPVLQPDQAPQPQHHQPSDSQPSHPEQFHHFHVPKPQSISATYDEAHRQFFSPPNVTVTGQGGFASPNSTHEASSGSQSHKSPSNAYAHHEFEQFPRGPHPSWYSGIPIHPHAYPQLGIPRGMYPHHYAYDPMVYPIHPTQNPFQRFGSHPMHSVILPRMIPPRYYPYRRHPSSENQYRPNSPASDPDFSKHPDFRKRSSSVSRPNSGNGLSYDPTSAKEEFEEYKKHSVFRLRANSLEKPKSPSETEGERRTNQLLTPNGEVSVQSSSSNPSVPINRNNALRKLLSHTSTTPAESFQNSIVDEDLQNEMRKIGYNSCNVGHIDELRMPSLVRGDALNGDSSSPNSSNSGESASTSPLLVDKIQKNPLACSDQVRKSVKIQGNVCIKQDLGDEGIVMLEFQGCKVDLVQCVLDEDILKLSNNPQELKDFIQKSQSTNNTLSKPAVLPAQNGQTLKDYNTKSPLTNMLSVQKQRIVNEAVANSLPTPVEDTTKGVLALADICSSLDREPPQLKKLGEIVAEDTIEKDSQIPPQPKSVIIGKRPEGWKESILKIFSANAVTPDESLKINPRKIHCRRQWTEFMSAQIYSDLEAGSINVEVSENREISDKHIFETSVDDIEPEDAAKTMFSDKNQNPPKINIENPQISDKNIFDKDQNPHKITIENPQISDKNTFDPHEPSVDNPKPERAAKTLNLDIKQNQISLKRHIEETECENSNSKKFKPEMNVSTENIVEKTTVKPNTIVNNLSNFVENTIDSYTSEDSPRVVAECDSELVCDDYQSDKILSELPEHEFLSEKTIVELKKKILNRNS